MKYSDVVYAAPGSAPAGMPSTFPLKGFRVVPVLAATATVAAVIAAYAALVVRVSRSSQSRAISGVAPFAVTDDISVVGPDWIRSPGFSALTLQGGVVGVTYRVWWAEDCYEVVDPGSSPYLNGFAGAGASAANSATAVVGPASAVTQFQESTNNIPSLSTDGIAVSPGQRGAYAVVSAAAAETMISVTVVWWRYVASLARWAESAIQEAPPAGRRDVYGSEQLVVACLPGDRLYAEARDAVASGDGDLVVTMGIA